MTLSHARLFPVSKLSFLLDFYQNSDPNIYELKISDPNINSELGIDWDSILISKETSKTINRA